MIITLTTDFGLDDPFVAMMKGVILGHCPQVQFVDICHTIPAQDICAASLTLANTAPYFPPATIHVAVVDPGVGTNRRIICLEAGKQLFLAPDNGLLTPFLLKASSAIHLTNDTFFRQPVSATFHGRDIFAPVAAALANGLDPDELGPPIPLSDLVHLEVPSPTIDRQQMRGQCLRADHFGNMATNISKKDLDTFLENKERPAITIGHLTITGLSPTYGLRKEEVIALINSSDHLEISMPGGNAAKTLNLGQGTPVIISRSGSTKTTP